MKLIVALDNLERTQITKICNDLKDKHNIMFKLNDSYTRYGPELVKEIQENGGSVFLDLKFFDIPNTMVNYMKAVADMGVYMCNLHCLSGKESMSQASQALHDYCQEKNIRKPLLIGVTILTSMNEQSLQNDILMGSGSGLGEGGDLMEKMVVHLAKMAKESGLDGVVCSAKEIRLVKEACGEDFITVTPGIRPQWAQSGDQKRVMTPKEAINLGTNYMVIGRPIVQAEKYGMSHQEAIEKIMMDF